MEGYGSGGASFSPTFSIAVLLGGAGVRVLLSFVWWSVGGGGGALVRATGVVC